MADDPRPNDDTESGPTTPTESEPSTTVTSAPANRDETPLQSTYAWSSDNATCGECGTAVTARWRDGEVLVCAACKSW